MYTNVYKLYNYIMFDREHLRVYYIKPNNVRKKIKTKCIILW